MTKIVINHDAYLHQPVEITGEQCHYLINVKRHKATDEITLQDKTGQQFIASIQSMDKKKILLLPIKQLDKAPAPLDITIIAAIPKGKIFDDIVRKLSETGIKKIIPALCERSVSTAQSNKIDRWQRIAEESLRQSGRSIPLIIETPLPLRDALLKAENGDKIFMHPYAEQSAGRFTNGRTDTAITAAIGPEGGFTESEVAMATELNFTPLQFGKHILKIETAILTAAIVCITRKGGLD